MCSAAYKYRMSNWFTRPLMGETDVVTSDSSVTFSFVDNTGDLTITYNHDIARWQPSRVPKPRRKGIFVSIDDYPAKRYRKSFYHSSLLKSLDIEPKIAKRICNVLGIGYERLSFQRFISTKGENKTLKIRQAERYDCKYTEYHMGAGERKIIDLILCLEHTEEKANIFLEEPEIALHPDAQRGLVWYLMNVCRRRGHQIIVSTHSTEIFENFPSQARYLMTRDHLGGHIQQNAPYLKAVRELSGTVRTNKSIIFVEDNVAQLFLSEILQRLDRDLLKSSTIIPLGDTKIIQEFVSLFRNNEVHCIGVRDPDIGEDRTRSLFSLPGDKAPEILLLASENLNRAEQNILNGIGKAFERAKSEGLTYDRESKKFKAIMRGLASELEVTEEELVTQLIRAWFLESDNVEAAKSLIHRIIEAFENG
jgi:hypothetical protein